MAGQECACYIHSWISQKCSFDDRSYWLFALYILVICCEFALIRLTKAPVEQFLCKMLSYAERKQQLLVSISTLWRKLIILVQICTVILHIYVVYMIYNKIIAISLCVNMFFNPCYNYAYIAWTIKAKMLVQVKINLQYNAIIMQI